MTSSLRRPPLSPSPGAVFLLVLLLGSCATVQKSSARSELRDKIWKGEYRGAVTLANELRTESPRDPELAELYDIAYEGYYLDMGRTATFDDRDLEALDWFNKAHNVAPDSDRVAWWQAKTRNKLARLHLELGKEAYLREDYQLAGDSFRLILSWMPEHREAREALEHLNRVLEYHEILGRDYYSDGVRSFAAYRLRAASREFMVTTQYLPGQERATQRARAASEMIAVERVGTAQRFEQEGFFAAANSEFRFALELDENNELAKAGIERLGAEARAARLLHDAEMRIYRQDFEQALALLDEGQALTERQAADFELARKTIVEERLSAAYEAAWNLEQDGSYELAAEAYAALLLTTDYYKDAKSRKTTLEGYVEMAADYYQRAADADDPALELEHLRSIEGFWPGYRDIESRMERLED